MTEDLKPATVAHRRFDSFEIVHGHIHRPVFPDRLTKAGWHFDSESTGRLWLRGEDEGISWSHGHNDGKDLLAVIKLRESAR